MPEWTVGEERVISFNGTEPFWSGLNKYGGQSAGFEVAWNGTIYAYFPHPSILAAVQTLLPKTRLITVKRGARQGKMGIVSDWSCFSADAPTASAVDTRPQEERKFENSLVRDDATNAQVNKDNAIARAVALGRAVELLAGRQGVMRENVTEVADYFLSWLQKK